MGVNVKKVVILSSLGPPRARSTWSGTTSNIIAALERAGIVVSDHTIAISKPRRVIYELAGRLSGWGARQLERVGPWHRHLRRLASAVAAREPADVVLHFGSSHLPLIAPRAGQRHYLVSDYNMHLLMTEGILAQGVRPRYRRAVLTTERAIAAQMSGVFTVSDYVREDWLREYRLPQDSVKTIGTGLGQPVMLEGHAKDYAHGHLLYIGRHSFDIKGGELLLAAFNHALRQRPDLQLVIIGDAADPVLAKHLPSIEANTAITFYQSGTPAFDDLVRQAALYVAPATAEPWGLVYLEAMMCETPVLALKRNAMLQLTDGGTLGFLVDEADPIAIGAAIVDAMSDPERLARMGCKGRAFVEATFTWPKVVQTILDGVEGEQRV